MRGISIGPANWAGGGCIGSNVFHEFAAEIGDGSEDATGNDIPFDFAEPEFDLIEA